MERLVVRGNMVDLLQTGLEKLFHLGQKYFSTISFKKSMKIKKFHFFRLLEHCMSFVSWTVAGLSELGWDPRLYKSLSR